MIDFLRELQKTKLPTLILIGIVLWFSVDLLKNSSDFESPSFIGGIILLIIGLLIIVISFFDYRNKEHIDNLLNNYKEQVNEMKKTNTALNRTQRDNLKNTSIQSKSGYESINPIGTISN